MPVNCTIHGCKSNRYGGESGKEYKPNISFHRQVNAHSKLLNMKKNESPPKTIGIIKQNTHLFLTHLMSLAENLS